MIKLLLSERSIRLPDQTKPEVKHSKHQHVAKKNGGHNPVAEVDADVIKAAIGDLL
jgi:hypothetical protein